MKKIAAAVLIVICPSVMVGLVFSYEAGLLPFWGMIALGAGCIYAEWWGLATIDHTDE